MKQKKSEQFLDLAAAILKPFVERILQYEGHLETLTALCVAAAALIESQERQKLFLDLLAKAAGMTQTKEEDENG